MKTQEYLLEIKKELSLTIREKIKSGAGVSEQELLSKSLDYLKRLYTGVPIKAGTPKRYFYWRSSDLNAVANMWDEIRPEIENHISETIKSCQTKKLVKEINQLAAKAKISEAMTEAGIKYQYVGQTYRAKISVLICMKRSLTFYVPYSKLNETLPLIMESLKLIRQGLEGLGRNVSLNKAYDTGQWI